MAALNIGRISLEVEPSEWSIERGLDSQSYTFRGFLLSATQAETQYVRNELINHHGDLIALTWDRDTWFNGYYYLVDVRVETVPMSYLRRGLFPFEISLFRVGGHASTELQSLVTSGDRQNDFATTPQTWHAVPPGTLAYDAGPGTSTTEITRESESGNLSVFLDIDATWDPSWSVEPANYYGGAVEIYTQDALRTGREQPQNDPTDWYMHNGLITVRARSFQSASDGVIEVRPFNGSSWDTFFGFSIAWNSTNLIPSWHYMTIVKNTPEACVIKLVRDAATVPARAHRHSLDILLRRGSHMVECIYAYSSSATFAHQVRRSGSDAASHPGGAASYITDASAVDGHNWVLGAAYDFSADTTNGRLSMDAANKVMPFFIGFRINGASDGSGDGPADLAKQYAAPLAETVRAVRR